MSIPLVPPKARKLLLTVHVVTSVGWLGTAFVTLVLIVAALVTDNPELRRSAYLVMRLFDSASWLPVGALALVSGVLIALTTKWGLVRYYWVAIKLVLTVVVFVLPLVFRSRLITEAIERTAEPGATAGGAGTALLIPGIMGLLVLAVSTILSIYKPWGRTPYGRRVAAHRVATARRPRAQQLSAR